MSDSELCVLQSPFLDGLDQLEPKRNTSFRALGHGQLVALSPRQRRTYDQTHAGVTAL